MYNAEKEFEKTGLMLPPAPKPLGLYKPGMIVDGKFLYLSGHAPVLPDGSMIKGRIGEDLDPEEGKNAARQAGLTMLATVKASLGSLNAVRRVIKVFGMVNCTPDFVRHPYIINGCSELLAAVWGNDDGVGTRSAIGMVSLPDNMAVEIEAIFELQEYA
jgi:enamine deaminase RidA (YjgF/YER057c/UK114 family)